MKKVKCNYEIEEVIGRKGWVAWTIHSEFYLEVKKAYRTKAGVLKALKRLTAKLNIELGGEVGR